MKVIADLCVVPIGVGTSVTEYVAACVRILEDAGLEIQLHAMGAPRISTNLRFGTRTDRDQSMQDKITSVQKILEQTKA